MSIAANAGRDRFPPGSLCADHNGFSLHAKVLVSASELERLEYLCRYVTRPLIATERFALSPDGRVLYGLNRHWRDGTSSARLRIPAKCLPTASASHTGTALPI